MIEQVKGERTEKVMKRINSSMEDYTKQMLDIIKFQRTSGESERTYITVQVMYLTLHVM